MQQQAPKQRKKGLIIGLSLGGAVLVAGLVVLVLFLTGGTTESTAATAITETTTDSPETDTTQETPAGRTADLEATYFGFRVSEESVDDLWMEENYVSETPRYNRVDFETFSSDQREAIAGFAFVPRTDAEVRESVTYGYEILGVLTLPNGYPLWMTVRTYEKNDEGAAWIAKHKAELYLGIIATDGATWEPGVPYTGVPILDYSPIEGIWYEEGKGEEFYLWVSMEGKVGGTATVMSHTETNIYLVPESKAVYRLYDDTNSPCGSDSYLLLEEDGTMAWCDDMGVVRFFRGEGE